MSWNSALPALNPNGWIRSLPRLWTHAKRFGGEFFWVGAGQIASAAGCIAGVRLLTEVMLPADYGDFMLAMTLVTLAQQLLASPLTVAAQRYYATSIEENSFADYEQAVLQLVRGALTWFSIIALLSVLVLWIGGYATVAAMTGTSAAFAVLLAVASVLDGVLNAARRRVVVAWHQAATQWLRWLSAVGAILLFGSNPVAAICGGCLALAVLCLTRWAAVKRPHPTSPADFVPSSAAHIWRQRLREYCWPFAMWGLFTWALAASDRWALAFFVGPAEVGAYAVLYQLGFFPCVLLADALQQLVAPILFQRAGSGTDVDRQLAARRWNDRMLLIFAGLLIITFIATCLLHRWLLFWLAGPAFRQHSALLPWVTLAGGFFALGQLAALGIVSGVSARCLLPVKIGSAVVGIIANFAAAMWLGLQGVVAASVFVAAIYFGWTLYVSRSDLLRVRSGMFWRSQSFQG